MVLAGQKPDSARAGLTRGPAACSSLEVRSKAHAMHFESSVYLRNRTAIAGRRSCVEITAPLDVTCKHGRPKSPYLEGTGRASFSRRLVGGFGFVLAAARGPDCSVRSVHVPLGALRGRCDTIQAFGGNKIRALGMPRFSGYYRFRRLILMSVPAQTRVCVCVCVWVARALCA